MQVTTGSKAALGGVKDGDYILMINDNPTEDLKHHDAQAMIRATGQTLRLVLSRYRVDNVVLFVLNDCLVITLPLHIITILCIVKQLIFDYIVSVVCVCLCDEMLQ